MCVNTLFKTLLLCNYLIFNSFAENQVFLSKITLNRISFYQAVPAQTDNTPTIAACGKLKSPWKQIAVSRDIFAKTGCNKTVFVIINNKLYQFVVWDKMNKRYKNSIDILVGQNEPAKTYGIKKGILLY